MEIKSDITLQAVDIQKPIAKKVKYTLPKVNKNWGKVKFNTPDIKGMILGADLTSLKSKYSLK